MAVHYLEMRGEAGQLSAGVIAQLQAAQHLPPEERREMKHAAIRQMEDEWVLGSGAKWHKAYGVAVHAIAGLAFGAALMAAQAALRVRDPKSRA